MRALDKLDPDTRKEAFDTVRYVVERQFKPAKLERAPRAPKTPKAQAPPTSVTDRAE